MNIGKTIQARRTQRAMTVADASRQAGVSRSYWEKLEAGQMGNPSVKILGRIAAALGCEATDLLTEERAAAAQKK